MEVILIKDVDKLGYAHDLVKVKDGFGRNYLIPQGLALIANKSNMARLSEMRKQEKSREAKNLGSYQDMSAKLEGVTLKIGAKAGKTGKIFGSVTDLQIMEALKNQFEIDIVRKKIDMPTEVKNLGAYKATLNFHPEVVREIDFEVVEE